jgi:hypothetical protein
MCFYVRPCVCQCDVILPVIAHSIVDVRSLAVVIERMSLAILKSGHRYIFVLSKRFMCLGMGSPFR